METLIDNGLFGFIPSLNNEDDEDAWTYWARRVVGLRVPFNNNTTPSVAIKDDLRKAIVMAENCFGGRWSLPMAPFLLALSPHRHDDATIVAGMLTLFTGKWKHLCHFWSLF